jgi:hypothetical protein
VSDGASSHFKNSKNMLNLTYHESDFGMPAVWTFSATSHGKGPVDGVGAALKSRAIRHLLGGTAERAFLSPEDFFQFTKAVNDHQTMKGDLEPNRPIEVFFVKKNDVEQLLNKTLQARWAHLPKKAWIDGIQSLHQFNPMDIGNMNCRRTSTSKDVKNFIFASSDN